jgi:hypothetical protein
MTSSPGGPHLHIFPVSSDTGTWDWISTGPLTSSKGGKNNIKSNTSDYKLENPVNRITGVRIFMYLETEKLNLNFFLQLTLI